VDEVCPQTVTSGPLGTKAFLHPNTPTQSGHLPSSKPQIATPAGHTFPTPGPGPHPAEPAKVELVRRVLRAGGANLVTVVLGVGLGGFDAVMRGVMVVGMGRVRVVRGGFMVTGFVMASRFAVMPRGVLVVFRCFVMMFGCLLGHVIPPAAANCPALGRAES
jgi:hypothetical protein